jgi:hypothetical protein
VSRRSRDWLDQPSEWSKDDLEYMSSLSWIEEDWARQTMAAERRTRRRLRRELLVRLLWLAGGLAVATLVVLYVTRVA